MLSSLFLINFTTTAIMVGVIWTIQIVHYPFFHHVDKQDFTLYMDDHRKKISFIVMPVMLAELASAIGLVLVESAFTSEFIIGLSMLLLIWISTAVLQVPSHSRLAAGYSRTEVDNLVNYNWIRTILWSLRFGLMVFVFIQLSFFDL